jgi:hypothetical protein
MAAHRGRQSPSFKARYAADAARTSEALGLPSFGLQL